MIMNFRDAYKSMNDEIHGDKALMHMIINGETPKKKKNFFLKFKPAYSVAIAAVFAVCAITLYHSTGFDDYSATTDKYDSVMTKGDKTPESDNDKTQNVTNSKNKDDDLNAADKSVSAQDTEDSTDYASQGNAEFDNTHNNYDNGNTAYQY